MCMFLQLPGDLYENVNPEMSDVGICVGSECRLANKKPTKKTNRCDDGKDAGQTHSQQFCF